MPEDFNASNAVQPSSKTCARQADGGGSYPVQNSSFVRTETPHSEREVRAFVDPFESTK